MSRMTPHVLHHPHVTLEQSMHMTNNPHRHDSRAPALATDRVATASGWATPIAPAASQGLFQARQRDASNSAEEPQPRKATPTLCQASGGGIPGAYIEAGKLIVQCPSCKARWDAHEIPFKLPNHEPQMEQS